MPPAAYRRDIDGLRAIAVLSVLLYHLGVAGFTGGFVGVDVFFVISGFLITRLIRDQKAAGTFTFAQFYVRRARRLFPALAVTIAATLAASAYFFTPTDLVRTAGSAISAILSVSNFYFWQQAGYFDAATTVKPLIHTWSLSVEEQFYFVWPAALVFLLGRAPQRLTFAFIAIIGVASLVVCQMMIESYEAVFYLSPFRASEFAIGAALVWVGERGATNKAILELALAGGLGLIAFSVLAFNRATPFPGLMAMIPCIGAALAIYGGEAPVLGRILSNAVMVRIGLISYSLYLAHWPLIVFYQYAKGGAALSGADQLIIATATIAAAELMYRFVETPFRTFKSRHGALRLSAPAFGLSCAAIAIALIAVSSNILASDGWNWRLTSGSMKIADAVAAAPGHRTGETQNPRYRVLVVGDSHANQHLDMLSDYFLSRKVQLDFYRTCLPFPDAVIVKEGRPDKYCNRLSSGVVAAIGGYDAVIVASRWDVYTETTHNPGDEEKADRRFFLWRSNVGDEPMTPQHSKEVFTEALAEFTQKIEKLGLPLLYLGQVPPVGSDYSRCATKPKWRHPEQCLPYYTRDEGVARVSFSDARLGEVAQRSPLVRHISFVDRLCPRDQRYCRYMVQGEFIYLDDDHVNFLGDRLIGAEIRPELDEFFELIAKKKSADHQAAASN